MATQIVHIRSQFALNETAARVFRALSISAFEERDSENYPQGVYYSGTIGDFKVKVARESDEGYEDYQYWVVLKVPASSPTPPDEALRLMVTELLKAGFPACREVGFTENAVRREVYTLDESGNLQTKPETKLLPSKPGV